MIRMGAYVDPPPAEVTDSPLIERPTGLNRPRRREKGAIQQAVCMMSDDVETSYRCMGEWDRYVCYMLRQ